MNGFESSDFTWFRPKRGGAFSVDVRIRSGIRPPYVPEPFLATRTDELEPYQPLKDETGIFLTFATTDRTPDGVLRFAQRYGRLGQGVEMKFMAAGSSPPGILQEGELCEPLTEWYARMGPLAQYYELWNMARKADREGLATWSKKYTWLQLADSATHQKVDPEKSPIEFAYHFLANQFSH